MRRLVSFALTGLLLLGVAKLGATQEPDCFVLFNEENVTAFYGEDLVLNPTTNRYEWSGFFDVTVHCHQTGGDPCCMMVRLRLQKWNNATGEWDLVDQHERGLGTVPCGEDDAFVAEKTEWLNLEFFTTYRVSVTFGDGCPPGFLTGRSRLRKRLRPAALVEVPAGPDPGRAFGSRSRYS